MIGNNNNWTWVGGLYWDCEAYSDGSNAVHSGLLYEQDVSLLSHRHWSGNGSVLNQYLETNTQMITR